MGADNSTPRDSTNLVGFNLTGTINDPRYGDVKHYENQVTKEQRILLTKRTSAGASLQAMWINLRNKGVVNHPNLLEVLDVSLQDEGNVCGDVKTVTMLVDYHSRTLQSEIEKRRRAGRFYSEEELWYILYAIVSGGAVLQSAKIFHGDLIPSNVFVTKEGFIKIADQSLVTLGKTMYGRAFLQDLGTTCYLAPSQLQDLAARSEGQRASQFKTDIFSLGMSILQAAVLQESLADCYDFSNLKFSTSRLQQYLTEATKRYSSSFLELLNAMLDVNDETRPDFTQIHQLLQPYAGNIEEKPKSSLPFTSPPQYKTAEPDVNYYSNNNRGNIQNVRSGFDPSPNIFSPIRDDKENQMNVKEAGYGYSEGKQANVWPLEHFYAWLGDRDPELFRKYNKYWEDLQSRKKMQSYISPAERDEYDKLSKLLTTGTIPWGNKDEEYRRVKYLVDIYGGR